MFLKQAIQTIGGLQYIIDQTNVLSPIGHRLLYACSWINSSSELNEIYSLTEQTAAHVDKLSKKEYADIEHLFCQVKDIERTIDGLMNGSILTDIEFFEIKSFALIAAKIKAQVDSWGISNIPSTEQIITLLDPENTRTASFYIYNAYDPRLAPLRAQLNNKENADIFLQSSAIEDEVRKNLAFQLRPLADILRRAMKEIGTLDILIAKALLNKELNLSRPIISEDSTTYTALFNPAIAASLKERGKEYQAINIHTIQGPTLITGINMGGKTVVLRTLALAQAMCQFGFFVPAETATVALVDEIMLSIEDKQDEMSGLSSYASEIMQINRIIRQVKQGSKALVLIDELARTTNPTEGRAIVEAMISFLSEHNTRSFITTHYDGITTPCRRLRVVGADHINTNTINIKQLNQLIDYTLIDDNSTAVPHEALNIARMLDIDEDFIRTAEEYLR